MTNIHTTTIDSLGGLGDGIASLGGKPLFVSKSCPGDVLRVNITGENADSLRGEIEEVLTPGPARIPPGCIYYDACGGCSLMHLAPDYYQDFKRRNFASALRHGDYPDIAGDVIFLPPESRRRVEFKWRDGKLGYYKQRSHTPVPIAHCLILEPALDAMIAPLNTALAPFGEALKSVSLTLLDNGIDLLLTFTVMPAQAGIQPLLALKNIARISVRSEDGAPKTFAEIYPPTLSLGAYPIPVPADAFLQASSEGQRILTDIALEGTAGATRIMDLFCGIGTYSFPLASNAFVHAAELDSSMIAAMQGAIKKHGHEKRLFAETRDLFKNPYKASELNRFDAIVLNPPRLGAKAQTQEIARSVVSKVVMISCNPASWSRDAKILKEAGFRLTKAVGIDQFVYSPHLEIASVFAR